MSDILENIKQYLDPLDDVALRAAVAEITVADLEDVWGQLDDDAALRVFMILPRETRGDLVAELSDADQEKLVAALSVRALKEVLEEMDPDDLVDLIQSVSPDIRASVRSHLSEEAREEADFLLRFDDDDAAGLMTTRYAAIRKELTVAQSLSFLRRAPEELETVYYVYVVDNIKRLEGVVSLRQLLFASDDRPIHEIMERNVISVREDTDQEETAKVLEDHDLIALPVIDRWNRLLGIVTFDDVIDVIREEQTEDIYRMGAIAGEGMGYLESSIPRLIWRRLPWLLLLLLAGTITTNVLAGYNDMMVRFAFLALFIPVITQTGGNSGTQSSTLMIRGLATGELRLGDVWKALGKEVLTGLAIGAVTGLVILLRSVFLPPGIEPVMALAVALSLSAVVLFATTTGCLIPFVIARLGGDPTVASGPLMSTLIDVAGLTIYFEVARVIL